MNDSIGREFIEKTKYQHIHESDQSKGLPQPQLELGIDEGAQPIQLPSMQNIIIPSIELIMAMEHRRSIRTYSPANVSLEELTYLLWSTQGVKKISKRLSTARLVPSAGARHAFETFLLVNRVTGLEHGLYRYAAIENQLIKIPSTVDIADQITQACLGQQQIINSAVTFLWVAVVERMLWRYPERGYRYLFLDAGHVCQNLYLAAEAIDCGVCAIAAYDDDAVNQVLHLDGVSQFVIYLASLGKKETTKLM